jgi:hypothetical protein
VIADMSNACPKVMLAQTIYCAARLGSSNHMANDADGVDDDLRTACAALRTVQALAAAPRRPRACPFPIFDDWVIAENSFECPLTTHTVFPINNR